MKVLEYTTKDNADAVITVGITKDGELSCTVYGENGKDPTCFPTFFLFS